MPACLTRCSSRPALSIPAATFITGGLGERVLACAARCWRGRPGPARQAALALACITPTPQRHLRPCLLLFVSACPFDWRVLLAMHA